MDPQYTLKYWFTPLVCLGILFLIFSFSGTFKFSAAAPEAHTASAEFSTAQGQGYKNWYYLDSVGNQMACNVPGQSCAANNPNAGAQPAWQGNETYLNLGKDWGHPGESADAVRRWQAVQAGTVTVSTNGNIYDADASCGDGSGVVVSIKKNGSTLWQASIPNGGSIAGPLSVSALNNVAIASGDKIDFGINKGSGNNWCDSTHFDPKITFTPSGSGASAGNLYITVKKDGVEVPATDCFINPLSGRVSGPFSANFTCLPHYYDKSIPVPTGAYAFAYTSGGPSGFTFQNITCVPSDCKVPAGKTLTAYYNFTAAKAGGNIKVAKTFYEVTPDNSGTKIKLDNGTSITNNPITFTNVTQGAHTISFAVPANVKAYYAICTNAGDCAGPMVYAGKGPGTFKTSQFTHVLNQQDFVAIDFVNPALEYGSTIIPFSTEEIKHFISPGGTYLKELFSPVLVKSALAVSGPPQIMGLWTGSFKSSFLNSEDYECSRTYTFWDVKKPSAVYDIFRDESYAWSLGTPISLMPRLEHKSTADQRTVGGTRYAVYPVADVVKTDSYNRIAFTDKYNSATSWEKTPKPYAAYYSSHGYGRIKDSDDGTVYVKHMKGGDIALNPTDEPKYLHSFIGHELGHAIGLSHSSNTSSLMHPSSAGNSIPREEDLDAVSAGYGKCGGAIKLNLVPTIAKITQGALQCGTASGKNYFKTTATISERGGKVGVTLKGDVRFEYEYTSGLGVDMSLPVSNLTKKASGSSKGFPDNLYIPPGGSISASLCQSPWDPEELVTDWMIFEGRDNNGKEVQTENMGVDFR